MSATAYFLFKNCVDAKRIGIPAIGIISTKLMEGRRRFMLIEMALFT